MIGQNGNEIVVLRLWCGIAEREREREREREKDVFVCIVCIFYRIVGFAVQNN